MKTPKSRSSDESEQALSSILKTTLAEAKSLLEAKAEAGRLPDGPMKDTIIGAIDEWFRNVPNLVNQHQTREEKVAAIVTRVVDADFLIGRLSKALFQYKGDSGEQLVHLLVQKMQSLGYKVK